MYSRFGYLSLIYILIGEHCGKVKDGDCGILGHTAESLAKLSIIDSLIEMWEKNPDELQRYCIGKKLVAMKDLDNFDLTLVKGLTSNAAQGDAQFVNSGKRATWSGLAPHQFSRNDPPGYKALPTDAGQVFVKKLETIVKDMTGNACADEDPRVYGHLYTTPANLIVDSNETMIDPHPDGRNKDGAIYTVRQTIHVGDEAELVLQPMYLIPDPTAKKGYGVRPVLTGGKGAVFPMGSSSKTILSFFGSGRGLIGLAWFKGQLVGVGMFHSVRPTARAGGKLRIMLATDLVSPSLKHHDDLVDRWVNGSLYKTFPDGILPTGIDTEQVSIKSIHDDLPKIVPFIPSDATDAV